MDARERRLVGVGGLAPEGDQLGIEPPLVVNGPLISTERALDDVLGALVDAMGLPLADAILDGHGDVHRLWPDRLGLCWGWGGFVGRQPGCADGIGNGSEGRDRRAH